MGELNKHTSDFSTSKKKGLGFQCACWNQWFLQDLFAGGVESWREWKSGMSTSLIPTPHVTKIPLRAPGMWTELLETSVESSALACCTWRSGFRAAKKSGGDLWIETKLKVTHDGIGVSWWIQYQKSCRNLDLLPGEPLSNESFQEIIFNFQTYQWITKSIHPNNGGLFLSQPTFLSKFVPPWPSRCWSSTKRASTPWFGKKTSSSQVVHPLSRKEICPA